MVQVREIGLKLLTMLGSPFFSKGANDGTLPIIRYAGVNVR